MNETLAALALAVSMIGLLAAFCAAGPVLDRLSDRRLAARREMDRVVVQYRPGAPSARLFRPGWRIEQRTPLGWAQLEVAL